MPLLFRNPQSVHQCGGLLPCTAKNGMPIASCVDGLGWVRVRVKDVDVVLPLCHGRGLLESEFKFQVFALPLYDHLTP